MRLLYSALLCLVFFSLAAFAQSPVVVELFTSEGCSSCPPADALLVQLSHMRAPNGAEIIVLGEHVDYWNHDGWEDRYSLADCTLHQQAYVHHFRLASAYTPQVVVDGTVQFVGNDKDKLTQAILQQSQKPKPAIVKLRLEGKDRLHVTAKIPNADSGSAIIAITEDGLTSEVGGGENRGRTLQHAGVVRDIYNLGALRDGEMDRTVRLEIKKGWNRDKLKVVVFVTNHDTVILGAASLSLQQAEVPPSGSTQTSAGIPVNKNEDGR